MLDVYELPYDPMYPVVCMDEKAYQLLDDVREPLSARPGSNLKTDSEYRRNGTCSIFAFVEPLGGRHHVSVHEHRTAIDWAVEIKLEIHYTPKHGSWLDMAEIELNVMTRQCLSRRIASIEKLKCELSAREAERNCNTAKIQWHFQTGDAREKLISLFLE